MKLLVLCTVELGTLPTRKRKTGNPLYYDCDPYGSVSPGDGEYTVGDGSIADGDVSHVSSYGTGASNLDAAYGFVAVVGDGEVG